MNKSYHILYKTTCLLNGKCYVGVHSTNNLNDGYLGSGTLFRKAVTKHGKENFVREIISRHKTRAELLAAERDYVNKAFVLDTGNYNLSIGGIGVSIPQEAIETPFERNSDVFYLFSANGRLFDLSDYKPTLLTQAINSCEAKFLTVLTWLYNNKHTKEYADSILSKICSYTDGIIVEPMQWEYSIN